MTEPENFLTRWSRRKLDAEEPAAPAAEATPQTTDQTAENADVVKAGVAQDQKAPVPAFDPATLPSLDSIGAETDIAAFLKAGVPGDLRLAALRRAWVTDPAIRDFKGLAENDWDFTVPNEAMGFGEIDPGLDLKKMLADVFGDKPRAELDAAEVPVEPEVPSEAEEPNQPMPELRAPPQSVALNSIDASVRETETAGDAELVHRNINDAVQSARDDQNIAPIARRRPQGGALPQ